MQEDFTCMATSNDEVEKQSNANSLEDEANTMIVNEVLERIVWRKLDLCILPVTTMIFFLSYLDRTNLGNAKVAGLLTDLKMTPVQYSTALTVTYVPYIVAELPANLLLKAVGPNIMLPAMLTMWGFVTTLQGVIHNYQGLLVCRFFLGLFEGSVFPGLVLYLSFFYPRQRLQLRVSSFFSASTICGAFSGLVAFGIINMDGIGGRPGWAWIFILEGLFTVLFGLSSFFLLPRSLMHARFFHEHEKAYVVAKLQEDGAISREKHDGFSWAEVAMAIKLPHVWLVAVTFFFNGTCFFGLAYFTPSIVQGLGYTAARAQLMSVPPYAVAFVVSVAGAWISDRYHCRGLTSIYCSILCIIGFGMFLGMPHSTTYFFLISYSGSKSPAIQYSSLFLSITGTCCAASALSTWTANNTAPHTRRATAIALGFIMTNSGGILATWLMGGALSPPPRYTKATIVMLVFSAMMLVLSMMNTCYLWDQSKRKAMVRETTVRMDEKPGMGDASAWFIYNL